MTINQILYQALRKAKSNYRETMLNPHSAGRSSERIDSAQRNAKLGWNWYLEQHNLIPHEYEMPEWPGYGAGNL